MSCTDAASKRCYFPCLERPLPGGVNGRHIIWLIIVGAISLVTAASGTGVAFCSGVVLLLVPHNSILTYAFGLPYERAIRYHIIFGGLILIPVVIHALNEDFLSEWSTTHVTGTVSFGAYIILVVSSFPFIRRRLWEAFKYMHLICAAGFVVFAAIHDGSAMLFLLPGIIAYTVDLFLRGRHAFIRGSVLSASVIKGTDVLKLEVESGRQGGRKGYEPGQYAFLMIPRLSPFQWHPISECGHPQGSTLTFCIKAMTESSDSSWSARALKTLQAGDTVRIDGPYGKVSMPFFSYRSLVMFAGGIGVTPMLSIVRDALHSLQEGRRYYSVENMELHLAVRSLELLDIMQEEIQEMHNNSSPHLLSMKIKIYLTGKARDHNAVGAMGQEESAEESVVAYTSGRPHVMDILRSHVADDAKQSTRGMASTTKDPPIQRNIEELRTPSASATVTGEQELPTIKNSPSDPHIVEISDEFTPPPSSEVNRSDIAVLVCGPDALKLAVERGCSSLALRCHSETFLF